MNIILFKDIPKKISIKDKRGQHIIKILKLKTGDEFNCGIVNGPSGIGSITSIDQDWIHFTWEKKADSLPLYPLTLLIGYTRPISSKRILREAASLGVERLVFVGTDTGEKSYRDSNLWKGEYKKYLMDGAQQAASTGIPDVEFTRNLDKFFREDYYRETDVTNIVLDNIKPDMKLSEYNPGNSNCLLAIGSERGWSERERKLFKKHGFVFAGLGERVLRTETASTAGITLMLVRMGLL